MKNKEKRHIVMVRSYCPIMYEIFFVILNEAGHVIKKYYTASLVLIFGQAGQQIISFWHAFCHLVQ